MSRSLLGPCSSVALSQARQKLTPTLDAYMNSQNMQPWGDLHTGRTSWQCKEQDVRWSRLTILSNWGTFQVLRRIRKQKVSLSLLCLSFLSQLPPSTNLLGEKMLHRVGVVKYFVRVPLVYQPSSLVPYCQAKLRELTEICVPNLILQCILSLSIYI